MMKHWLTNTHWIEILKKTRTRRRIEPRASRCPVENFATAPHGTTAVPRVINTSQNFITISGVSSDQHNTIFRNIWRWPISFTLARRKQCETPNNACEDQNEWYKPVRWLIKFMMKHWLTNTMNWESEKIRTRRRIEPRASRCPVENFATASHGITAVPRVI